MGVLMSEPVLYIVATPIGNLADLSARAQEVLGSVDYIAAEDTRYSGRLLAHFTIKAPMISVHDHNERQRSEHIINLLAAGHSIALVSDAGTPLISDPGFHLVRAVREAGYRVSPVPGCCAFVAALSASGLPSDRFQFIGFLPAKSGARLQTLKPYAAHTETLIFYESTHRIVDSLAAMAEAFGGERYAVVARELTKTFETIHGDTLQNLLEWIQADSNQQRGEFVVLVHGAPASEQGDQIDPEAERILHILAKEMPPKKAAGLAAEITGEKKNRLYQLLIQ
ncbi:16S rRNA (cytidine1402-2'-O)-methyltransferase [Marinobacterium iners DSM 11526]|uniref:Ribosomal RNA small subunit methyltransferase I n=2 Tax=Marinobacterium iners TaxID=48076 RepID=A0A1H4CYN6_9GAMM|nr:16S rRNA (cytidine1402-2'-O)-methyltransferase [Marinobacterium iners DSM 11526]